ncbi:alpha/beta hydrolase [Leptospira fluminis]|uniref:Alpha/beta hydrolase n=1 Tax=Leptospira fluminis TaxID=2484979 RepID=A0A4R9GUQ7_9LEPT|nr:alpha/beta hydrolase [Leptospira fluminis]TGK21893.1 alpha/beta hydrolase [Leptospira fluminis]
MIDGTVFTGFPFLLRYAGFRDSPVPTIREVELESETGVPIRTKIFGSSDDAPVIYLQHGMSAKGIEDNRILVLATHLRNTGFNVYLPELTEVKNLQITDETVAKIRSVFRIVGKREEKPVSFLSASFSAGMGMVALAQEEDQSRLAATLLVGTYFDFGTTLPYVVSNFERDPYAVFVVLYNYVDKIRPELTGLKRFYLESSLDAGLQRTGDAVVSSKLVSDLSEKEKEFVRNVGDPSFRAELSEEILNQLPRNFIRENSPRGVVDSWRTPIALLHGADDPVIPPTESETLYSALRERKIDSNHLSSKLLTHGDHLPFYTQIPEILPLARIWGYFLEKASDFA